MCEGFELFTLIDGSHSEDELEDELEDFNERLSFSSGIEGDFGGATVGASCTIITFPISTKGVSNVISTSTISSEDSLGRDTLLILNEVDCF